MHKDFLMKKQRGLTLLEIIVSLGILSTVIMGIVRLQDNVSEDTRASVNALHIKAVGQAAQEYIKDNYATLTGVASATNPALIRVSDLIAGGYLNSGFNVKNEKQQDTCVLVLEPTANKLMALVATEGGSTINDLTLGQIAATVGGEGGGIYSTNTGQIRGSMGGWSVDLTTAPYSAFTNTNNLGLKCDGLTTGAVSLSVGHSFMALWFTSGGNLSSTLYRDAVPGNPGLNTMNTPILMGAGSIQTSGSACTTNGALGRDSTGALLSCVSNVWTAPSGSSPYWGDPVATFASLPVCNAANTGQTRVVRTPTTGSGSRAYTCNGAGAWQPLSLADNGSITIPGTASIDKLSGNLQITSTATENTACSPNGRIASDANGLILSCQSGSWKKASGSGGSLVNGVQSSSTVMSSCGSANCVTQATCTTGTRITGFCVGNYGASGVVGSTAFYCQNSGAAGASTVSAIVTCR